MRKRDEMLHRIHDGELEGQPPELDADDRARLEALDELGQLLRNIATAEAAAGPALDAWAGIEQRLRAVDQAQSARTASRQQAMRSWRHRLRRRALLALPLVAAAAAAVVLWFGSGQAAATNGCDIELLDVSGASAAVIQVPDREGAGSTTVIWTTED